MGHARFSELVERTADNVEKVLPGKREEILLTIPLRDFPAGMILVALTFFALLFTLVWKSAEWAPEASVGTIFVLILDLFVAGVLILVPTILVFAVVRSKTIMERYDATVSGETPGTEENAVRRRG